MKRFILNFCLLLSIFSFIQAQNLEQKIYIDFGTSTITTESPDINGNYWNNATDGALTAAPLALMNSTSAATNYVLEITKKFSINATGAGGLTTPDPELLGDLAIATATGDYFFVEGGTNVNGAFRIRNLNPERAYKYYIFGSRSDGGNRTAQVTLTGSEITSGTFQTTGSNLGGEGINQNTSNIFESEYVFPNINGEIGLELHRLIGSYAHINVIRIEEYSGVEPKPSPSASQSIYIDLGKNGGDTGNLTESPDINGNYWNNAHETAAGSKLNLINAKDASTGFVMEVTKRFNSNGGDAYGGLMNPDSDLLHDFAIPTATEDYFFVEGATDGIGELTFKNLEQSHGYRFYIFGSRVDNSSERTALYTITGLNTTVGTHHTSGVNLGGQGVNQNNRNIFQSDIIFPNSNGEIALEVTRYVGTIGHINIIKIEEYIDLERENATAINIDGENITVSGATTQMTYEIEPITAVHPAIVWSVNDETIAWIDDNGKLCPKANGTVTVTATITYGDYSISGNKEINITNQNAQLYFVGTASEKGEGIANAIPMNMLTDLNGSVSGEFEIYTSLKEAGEFHFYTSIDGEEAVIYGQGDHEEGIAVGGTGIRSFNSGLVRITVDLNTQTYTILPIESVTILGSLLPTGWSNTGGEPLEYIGDGVWENTFTFNTPTKPSDISRFIFCINQSWDYQLKKVKGTNNIYLESVAQKYGYQNNVEYHDIYLRNGKFRITLDLRNNVYDIECLEHCEHVIAVMGSSVANGQGATDNQGYAYMYSQLLNERAVSEEGYPWLMSHISVNGNNTTNLLDRFEKDLLSNHAPYVMYGVSLGNEGIHDNGQASFDSYLANMNVLINQAYENGITPIACNNYTRTDFTLTDYQFIKDMNLLMHEWDTPTINLLGAIDNGQGKWATGYGIDSDIYHPNHQGHREFFYAIVPSLLDALHDGKPQPRRISDVSYAVRNERIELIPEHTIHPYTLVFDVKTSSAGVIATALSKIGTATLEIVGNGDIKYTSPTSETIQCAASLTDNQWHTISITHYYAWGKTFLYVDKIQVGELNEKLEFEKFWLGDEKAPEVIEYSQLHFYRAAMNEQEIAALVDGKMLKSSLEIYAPLDGNADEPLINLAQSNNVLTIEKWERPNSIDDLHINQYPKRVDVYSVDGKKVTTFEMESASSLPQELISGFYIIDNKKVIVK